MLSEWGSGAAGECQAMPRKNGAASGPARVGGEGEATGGERREQGKYTAWTPDKLTLVPPAGILSARMEGCRAGAKRAWPGRDGRVAYCDGLEKDCFGLPNPPPLPLGATEPHTPCLLCCARHS